MLDEFQTAFCESDATNIRLLAPAGSGKTHSLLHRCKRVYEKTQGKSRFLIVTFTRAARDELVTRLNGNEFPSLHNSVDVTTLNSWGWKRVRERHHNPKLLSQKERTFAVNNSLQPVWKKHKSLDQAMTKQKFVAGKVILQLMDDLKNLGFNHVTMKSIEEVNAYRHALSAAGLEQTFQKFANDLCDIGALERADVDEALSRFYPFWRAATKSLIEQAVFTLEDQKYVALRDVDQQITDERLPSGGSKYSDVLVDEFQDISPLDLQLITQIANLHRARLVIVGDDDQAIFEWRGATPSYILNPERWLDRPFETFILERNYRCPKNIVHSSQSLIVNNKNRYPKNVIAMQSVDAKVDVFHNTDFTDSIDQVVEEVSSFQQGKQQSGERIALVSRKRAQLIPYQVILAQKGISFCAAEDLQVFLSAAFESLVQMLTIRIDADERRMARKVVDDILTLCNQVKRYPLNKSDATALRSFLTAAKPRTILDGIDVLEEYRGTLKGDNSDGQMSHAFASALRDFCGSETVSEAVEAISDCFSGLHKDYGKAEEDIFYSDPPFFYLARYADRYDDDFEQFIEDIETAAETLAAAPTDDDGTNQVWKRPVHLMTALRAKGKEFHTVVILDANDGIWPSKQAETSAQKEGERRIFYVAMTRAKKRLILTVSKKIGASTASPSPYLAEAKLVPTLV